MKNESEIAEIKRRDTNSFKLKRVKIEARPSKATQGGIFALEPKPTVCQESAYERSKSIPLLGITGSDPPTRSPNLARKASKEKSVMRTEAVRIGRLVIVLKSEGVLTNSISALSSASSFKSKVMLPMLVFSSTFAILFPFLTQEDC